ncbi:MAG: Rha family transcriptional regulator [Alphaproteobacteria bacterium]
MKDIQPVVHVKDNVVFANSKDVAEFFGKQHTHVVRDIDDLISKSGDLGEGLFLRTTFTRPTGFGVREYPAYDMTKDGFTVLVMGYTGQKAMQFKLRYIERLTRFYPRVTPNGRTVKGRST